LGLNRDPILDYRLVELSAKIPTKYKLNFKDNKIIFKEAFAKELPSHLFNQPKRGWLSPAAKWLRDELKDFSYDVINKNYTQGSEEFIDFKAARKLLDDHIEGKKYNLHLIWILITWQLWYKKCCL